MGHWSSSKCGLAAAFSAVCVLVGLGCVAEQSSASSSAGSAGFAGGGAAPQASASGAQPMLVDVDPDRTMSAVAGQGVGVFTEYASGGHWRIWWICDSSTTQLPCDFDVIASVDSGAMTGVAGDAIASSDRLLQATPQRVEAVTTTTLGTSSIRFDADPAAIITLDARLNGVEDGKFLFFVQGGAINGSYTGALTDPLMLEAGPAAH
ncbi:MAG: hypothetical protein M3O36_02495 [Myxococcota bacterium]|nr:hypothetical protein [Myxococcota bacterium]